MDRGDELLQRAIHVRERAAQIRAETVDGGNDCERDAGRDQTIFDRGSPRLISPERFKKFPQSLSPVSK